MGEDSASPLLVPCVFSIVLLIVLLDRDGFHHLGADDSSIQEFSSYRQGAVKRAVFVFACFLRSGCSDADVRHYHRFTLVFSLASGLATRRLPSTSTSTPSGNLNRKVAIFFGIMSVPCDESIPNVFFVSSMTDPCMPLIAGFVAALTLTVKPISSCRRMFCAVIGLKIWLPLLGAFHLLL